MTGFLVLGVLFLKRSPRTCGTYADKRFTEAELVESAAALLATADRLIS